MAPELTLNEFNGALRRLLVLACAADDVIEPAEVEMLQKVFRSLAGSDLTESDLMDELSELQGHPVGISEYVSSVARRLSWDRKQTLLKAAILVATADGTVQDEEGVLVESVASALAQDSKELDRLIKAVQYKPKSS